MMKNAWLLLLALICPLSACGQERPKTTVQELNAEIKAELPTGAASTKIESFIKRHKISFSWDRFAEQYAGIVRDVEPGHSITIDIATDKQRRFMNATVRDAYSGL